MRLYLDGMFYRSTGVGRLFENLLGLLLEEPGLEALHTAVPEAEAARFRGSCTDPRVVVHELRCAPMTVGDLAAKGALLRSLGDRVQAFLFPGHNVPLLSPPPYAFSLNDTTAFSSGFRVPASRRLAFRALLARSVDRAEAVLAISRTAADDVASLFPAAAPKIRVVHPWVDGKFFSAPSGRPERPVPDGPYLLYVGLRIAHKNVGGLLEAFDLLAPRFPGLRVVVAGRRYASPDMVDAWRDRSPNAARLVEFVDASDDELLALFRSATAFVFPSLAEGFGLPPLEAMAAGAPVLCTDLPVFREVCGDAAAYVPDGSPDSIAAGVEDLLRDGARLDGLRAAGAVRAALFTRSRCAPPLRELVLSLAGR